MVQKVYSIEEVAAILQLHPRTVRRRIQQGEIDAQQVGRKYRISQTTVDRLCGVPAAGVGLQRSPTADTAQQSYQSDRSTDAEGLQRARAQGAYVSAVIDIEAILPEQGMRLTNTIMAVMNSGATTGGRVECVYYEGRRVLKVIMTGELARIPELMLMIRGLLTEQGPF